MKYHFFSMIFMAMVVVQSAPLETITPSQSSSSEMSYLPPIQPEITSYEYTPTDTGYTYRLAVPGLVIREETLEVRNKGTDKEETAVIGLYFFDGDDGYRYYIKYTIDNNGIITEVEAVPRRRVPPNVLKSLVG
ncbi:uncharacterized protein LOC116347087 [Contarinia nasturtii]|uniref:uncharacterized protein LOC116347087 n=1 Tax=Contarinia nasturtii TaxID=265458 RepID=UPI0012D47171|nr:uncharacterized protein LOC116347087 [Contarinia nasturtii]